VKRAASLLGALSALAFIVWIIHEANIGRDNALFHAARATPYGDKLGHVLVAGVLTLVANFLARQRVLRIVRLPLPIGSLLVLGLAIAEEASQLYLPTRSFDLADGIANLCGIALFSIPTILASRKRAR